MRKKSATTLTLLELQLGNYSNHEQSQTLERLCHSVDGTMTDMNVILLIHGRAKYWALGSLLPR
jgi:hypothetical protein